MTTTTTKPDAPYFPRMCDPKPTASHIEDMTYSIRKLVSLVADLTERIAALEGK